MQGSSGYREREHTADWELEVWATDMEGLFESAARGMFALCGARGKPDERQVHKFSLEGVDYESLLVSFLQELLYFSEMEGRLVDTYELHIERHHLEAMISGTPLAGLDKEIKAVTYHNIKIVPTEDGLRVSIVFDV
jgi:SHS2 domain-containing protein